jgi:hypothetical protein
VLRQHFHDVGIGDAVVQVVAQLHGKALEGFALVSSELAGGTLMLTFDDPQNKTSGGSCRVSILRAQIEATAKQFPGVNEVRFVPAELFQP